MQHIKHHLLAHIANIKIEERAAVLWSFLYFFSLLCSYYIIRPIRDEMGVQGGVDNLQWLFTATFVAMLAIVPLFGWISSRFPRKRFLPIVYYFFVANLIIFYVSFNLDFDKVHIARVFFVWVSVFNLFVVSVFWSVMVDVFSNEQSKRLFGFIAAGGTVGAISGPALTTFLAVPVGKVNLLLISAGLLLALLFLAAYLLVDAWLEGAGGRRALERALQDRIGLPVRLDGEFRVVLLPSVGVSGTALVVGEPGPATELLRSDSYAVSLALEPLFHRRLSIDSVEFGNGTLHLERWPESEAPSTRAPQSTVQLPEIERLEILDFKVFAAADGDQPYLLRELSIEQFAAGRASAFRLEVEDYGAWDGSLTWDPQRSHRPSLTSSLASPVRQEVHQLIGTSAS